MINPNRDKKRKEHFHSDPPAHISLFISVCNVYTSTNPLCQPDRNARCVCGTVCWCTGVRMVSAFLKAQTKGRTLFTKLTVIRRSETRSLISRYLFCLSVLCSVFTHRNATKLIQIYWQQLFCSVSSERKGIPLSYRTTGRADEAMQSCGVHWTHTNTHTAS